MLENKKISEYVRLYNPIWNPILPEWLPPEDILVPNDHTFYRLVKNDAISDIDFKTHLELFPDKDFGKKVWMAFGLSLYSDFNNAQKMLKLPNFKNNKIARVVLNPPDGVLMQTSKESHFTFWKTTNFEYGISSTII